MADDRPRRSARAMKRAQSFMDYDGQKPDKVARVESAARKAVVEEATEQHESKQRRKGRKGRGMRRANTMFAYENHPETRHLEPHKMGVGELREALEQRGGATTGTRATLEARLTSLPQGGAGRCGRSRGAQIDGRNAAQRGFILPETLALTR